MPEDVAWLTEDEQRAWRAFLEATQLLFHRLDRELQQDAGLSQAEYEILVRLSEVPGRSLRMGELANQTLFSRSRLSHAVARLEAAGWVRRHSCVTDGRGTEAVLLDKGKALLDKAARAHVAAVRRYFFDQLSKSDVARIERIADAVREPLREADGAGRVVCEDV